MDILNNRQWIHIPDISLPAHHLPANPPTYSWQELVCIGIVLVLLFMISFVIDEGRPNGITTDPSSNRE